MVDYHEPVSKAAEVTNDLIATVANGKTTMGQRQRPLKIFSPFHHAGMTSRIFQGL